MTARTRALGYAEPSSASPFALAAPDREPLPATCRCRIEWHGDTWREIAPEERASSNDQDDIALRARHEPQENRP